MPLGNIAVFGSAFCGLFFNLRRRHPKVKSKTLVDWDVISMMEPTTMIGAILGTYLHGALPESLTSFLLLVLLSITSFRMIYKGIQPYLKPRLSGYRELTSNDALISDEIGLETFQEETKEPNSPLNHISLSNSELENGYSSFQIVPNEKELQSATTVIVHPTIISMIPWETIGILILLFIGTVSINFIKLYVFSHNQFSSPEISLYNRIFSIAVVSYILVIAYWLRIRVVHSWELKKLQDYQPTEGEVEWTPRNSILYPILCMVAGVIAGLFGLGGIIILCYVLFHYD